MDESTLENVWKNRNIDPLKVFDDINTVASSRTIINSDRLFGCAGILGVEHEGEIKVVKWLPTGITRRVKAVAIGNRAQSCKTVLENFYENHQNVGDEELLNLAISAMKNAHGEEGGLKRDDVDGYVLRIGENVRRIDSIDQYL